MTQSDTVTNAELRRAMEKLTAAYIKSTQETGEVLFGNSKTGDLGMIGSEMKMGISSADMTKSALNAQADGMIVSGVFSVVAGCAAIAGAGMEMGAIGGEMSASAEIDAMPTVEEGAEPTTQEASSDLTPAEEAPQEEPESGGNDNRTETRQEELERLQEDIDPQSSSEMRNTDEVRDSEMSMQERTQAREDEERTLDTRGENRAENTMEANNQDQANVEVEDSQQGMTAEQKSVAKEKISKEAQQKIAKAREFQQAGMAVPQAMGSLGQSQFKQDEATQQAGAQVRQTEQQAINTSSQVAQKFYGDLQRGLPLQGKPWI